MCRGVQASVVKPHWQWRRRRFWYQITCHPLLWAFSKLQGGLGSLQAHFQCSLQRPDLAYLRDHAVLGRALLPTSALLEAAGAAAMLLSNQADQAVEGHSSQSTGVTNIILSAPAMLPTFANGGSRVSGLGAASIRPQQKAVLDCTVDCIRGTAHVGVGSSTRPETPALWGPQPTFKPALTAHLENLRRPTAPVHPPATTFQHQPSPHRGHVAAHAWGGARETPLDGARVLTAMPDSRGLQTSGYHAHPATTDCAIHAGAALQMRTPTGPAGSGTPISADQALPAAPLQLPAAAGLYAVQPSTSSGAHSAIAVTVPTHMQPQQQPHAGDISYHELFDPSQAAACPVMSLQGLLTRPMSHPPQPTQHSALDQTPQSLLQVQSGSSGYPLSVAAGPAAGPVGGSSEAAASLVSATAVKEIVERVIGSSVDDDQPLLEAGLDSIGAVELRNAIAAAFGADLPATVTFDYPTVQALTSFLAASSPPAASQIITAAPAALDGIVKV